MRQHPKWTDACYRVHSNRYPELHQMSVRQVKEESQMQTIHSGDDSRPEYPAMDFGTHSDIVAVS
jgi:hypothetical protein